MNIRYRRLCRNKFREFVMTRTICNDKGFTLVEMIVVTAVLVMVIMISGSSFNAILSNSIKLMREEESNIEGVIGLELFRHDLEQAGYGLPWVSMNDDLDLPTYEEAASAPHSAYNDGAPFTTASARIPRAIVAGNDLPAASGANILAGTDYLAIKATTVGRAVAAQRWTYINYSGIRATGEVTPKPPHVMSSDNIPVDSGVIITRRDMVRSATGLEMYAPKLIYDPGDTSAANYFSQKYPDPGAAFSDKFSPQRQEQVYFVYGVDDNALRMPFNRTNYYVARPADKNQIPAACRDNPNIGILYKANVNHGNGGEGGGGVTPIPILDCVADMQVVFGWNMSGDIKGGVDTYSNADGSAVSGVGTMDEIQSTMKDADLLRERLKIIKVFILAIEGRKDKDYFSGDTIRIGDLGEANLTKIYDLKAKGINNYRWRVYKIVARPKNLLSNQ